MDLNRKLTHVDLFCGGGGFGLGFEMSGFDCLLANDMNKDACNSYEINLGTKPVNCKLEDLDYSHLINKEVDVLTAGFPCQPFSVMGKLQGWNDIKSSFYDALINMIDDLSPKFIVFENVKNFSKHNNGESIKKIIEDVNNLGYICNWTVLNSQYYNVPQTRNRTIMVFNRLNIDYEFPDIVTPEPKSFKTATKFITNHNSFDLSDMRKKYLKHIPAGGSLKDAPLEVQQEYADNKTGDISKYKVYFPRASWDKPVITLSTNPVTNKNRYYHPVENRVFSIEEYKVLQTFPLEYELCGSLSSQYRQIGNAIPVNLSYYISKSIKKHLEN